ncbi:hypothetical protein DPMN_083702 [Dreissena polymorpha]|uniref:Uncharacterized protein n=1 Tax=Dreissena polymorpha TaxID=45954 RepID=A0A9D3YAD3_DREPO|nr:hypothetical protein DPMN_083702 [Dreissena polymorpha]
MPLRIRCNFFADIKSVLIQLHKHYHYSSKAMRELQELAVAMGHKILRPANLEGKPGRH